LNVPAGGMEKRNVKRPRVTFEDKGVEKMKSVWTAGLRKKRGGDGERTPPPSDVHRKD